MPGPQNAGFARARQAIGPLLDRHRPFRIFAQRQTWHAQNGCLLLNAAGIGQYNRAFRHEGQKIQIAQRLNQKDAASDS
jgi:hypothetical protein